MAYAGSYSYTGKGQRELQFLTWMWKKVCLKSAVRSEVDNSSYAIASSDGKPSLHRR